jgi:ribosome-associated toxin RatA of RatAB toxin-antitoxin module
MADLEGTRTLDIDAPPERCFSIAADLDNVPEWHGAMKNVEILERDSEGRATLVNAELDASVTRVTLRLRFSYDEPSGVRWTRDGGDLKSLDGTWRFEPLDGNRTRATYSLEIGVGRRLAMLVKTIRGPVRARVESLLADRPVEGLKARAESAS